MKPAQVIFVIRDLTLHEGLARRLSIVREVKQMYHIRLLLLHRLPAEVNDALEAESLMVFFPTMSNKDGIRLRKWHELEF